MTQKKRIYNIREKTYYKRTGRVFSEGKRGQIRVIYKPKIKKKSLWDW